MALHEQGALVEVGASSRISVPQPAGDFGRPAPRAPSEAVTTELPARKSVQQSSASETAADGRGGRPGADAVDRNLTIDLETQKVVFRAVDQRTGEVIIQIPDPRYLKAYLDQKKAAEVVDDTAGDKLARSA